MPLKLLLVNSCDKNRKIKKMVDKYQSFMAADKQTLFIDELMSAASAFDSCQPLV